MSSSAALPRSLNLFARAHACLVEADVQTKLAAVRALWQDWEEGCLSLGEVLLPEVQDAGRPERPQLVPPAQVARRRIGSPQGHAALVHAVAHIEFNAINLACDAVWRFRDMPSEYYGDWLKVALDEAYHFSLLQERLQQLGYSYGDFPAHNGLWELAWKTRADPLRRMALVPRVMEARGLDVTPGMIERFASIGDEQTVRILQIILRDEVTHVEAGSRWFKYLCAQRDLDPERHYFELLETYFSGGIRCPLHRQARLEAGFSHTELAQLEALCKKS